MFKNIFILSVLCIFTIVIFGCAEEKIVKEIIYIDSPGDSKVVPPDITPPVVEGGLDAPPDITPPVVEGGLDAPPDITPPVVEGGLDAPPDITPPVVEGGLDAPPDITPPVIEGGLDAPPDELAIGDKVIVQNASKILENGKPHGIHTRTEPELGDEFISGHVFDGAVGTIFGGPRDDGTYTWWHILWNLNDPNVTWVSNVEDKCKNEQCFVWSAESIQGEVILIKK